MSLHMHLPHQTDYTPDWRAAAWSGVAAGTAFLLLLMPAMAMMGSTIWEPLRMIAAVLLGKQLLVTAPHFSPLVIMVALSLHFALAVAMGLIMALLLSPCLSDANWTLTSVAGALFGLVVYFFNYYGMAEFFPWFALARNGVSLLAHLLFGIVMADTYRKLERHPFDETPAGHVG